MKRMLAALVLLIILACALSCAHAQEIPEDILLGGIELAHKTNQEIVKFINASKYTPIIFLLYSCNGIIIQHKSISCNQTLHMGFPFFSQANFPIYTPIINAGTLFVAILIFIYRSFAYNCSIIVTIVAVRHNTSTRIFASV